MTNGIGNIDRPTAKQQVFRLLVVLGSAVLLGCLIVMTMIYSWGPNGSYSLTDMLLAPETLPKLAYHEQGGGKDSEKLVFDSIEFGTFDPSTRQWKKTAIPLGRYQQFYSTIATDRSIPDINDAEPSFDAARMARLTLWVRTKDGSASDRRIFQEVDIPLQGDVYRVEMYGSQTQRWIYFRHADIGQIANQLFLEHL